MKISFKILFLLISLNLLSCKNSENEIEKMYIAEWKSTKKPVPFKAILKIKSDKTFEYNTGACMSRSYSKGTWKLENDTLILNSFEPKECYFLTDFGINCVKFTKPGEEFEVKKSIKDCEPDENQNYDVFKNIKFYRKDTSLVYKAEKENGCPKDYQVDNNFTLNK